MAKFSGKITLLANYVLDEQESMQRFAAMMAEQLEKRGVRVRTIRPEPKLGRIASGGRGFGKWMGYGDKFLLFPRRLKSELRNFGRGDVLHICDHSNAVYTSTAKNVPHLVTCHDLLAVRSARGEILQNPTRTTGRVYQKMIVEGLNRAQRVACVSRATQSDLARLSTLKAEAITLIQNGLNYPYSVMAKEAARSQIVKFPNRLPGPFILHVGGDQWYKNRRAVVGIFQKVIAREQSALSLVMIGKPLEASLQRQISESGLKEKVVNITGCDNEDLRAFYSLAECLLFPSLQEGFGWPIVEAQACGCPVATSDRPPMTEVGGNAAVFFDPENWEAATASVRALLQENEAEKQHRVQTSLANAANFSAERMIERYLEEYEIVAGQNLAERSA